MVKINKAMMRSCVSGCILAFVVLLAGTGLAMVDFTYDFSNLIPGGLSGQDGWTVTFGDLTVTNGPAGSVNTTQCVQSPPGDHGNQRGMTMYFTSADTAAEQRLWVYVTASNSFATGGAVFAGGSYATGLFGADSYGSGTLRAYYRLPVSGLEIFGDSLAFAHWYEFKLVMDFSVSGGLANLYYRDRTAQQTIFTLDGTIRGKNMGLTPNGLGEYWVSAFALRMFGDTYADNYSLRSVSGISGRQMILNRGLQIGAVVFTDAGGFSDINRWLSSNFTTINFWSGTVNEQTVLAQLPTQQWERIYSLGDLPYLKDYELPYANNFVRFQYSDELADILTPARLYDMEAKFTDWGTWYPNTIAHTNSAGMMRPYYDADFTYNFSNLSLGGLSGQDGWTVTFGDLTVTNGPAGSVNPTQCVYSPAGDHGNQHGATMYFTSADTAAEQRLSVYVTASNSFATGGAVFAGGSYATGLFGADSYGSGTLRAYYRLPVSGLEIFGDSLAFAHWYEFKLVMDFSVSGGLANLYYRDRTAQQALFTLDGTIRGKNMGLTPNGLGEYWTSAFALRMNGDSYVDDYFLVKTFGEMYTYMASTQPDMIMMDTYPDYVSANFYAPTTIPGPNTWYCRTDWYWAMQRYRIAGLAGNDDTGTKPIPYAQYINLFRSSYAYVLPDESFVRLQEFASWTFGYTLVTGFIYNGVSGTAVSPVMFSSDGDTSPTVVFDYVKTANQQSRNLGPALVRLVSTDIRMVRGKRDGALLPLPSGISAWSQGAGGTRYITSITPRGKNNTNNPPQYCDWLVGYFQPLQVSNPDYPYANGLHFMICNGAMEGTALASGEWVRIEFDFSGTGYNKLQRLSRTTGLTEVVNLTSLGSGRYRLDLKLDGGTGDIFRFYPQ